MASNFCPSCGHRNYQHSAKGCEHTDPVMPPLIDVLDAHQLTPQGDCLCGAVLINYDRRESTHQEGWSEHVVQVAAIPTEVKPCDCKRPHPLMIEGAA